MGKYQEFDPLTPEEFVALENDILERGVLVPIEFDEDGDVIDGHHRLQICEKHGITDYPSVTRTGLTEEQKRDHAQTLNMARRSLSREQRRKQIQNRLKRHPDYSDRKIARGLGVDHKTVSAVRQEMEHVGEIPQVTEKVGLNGVPYKRRQKPKLTDSTGGEIPQQLEKVFATVSEYRSLINILTEVKRRIVVLGNISPVVRERQGAAKQNIDSIVNLLELCVPGKVHRDCGGDGCEACSHLGFTVGGQGGCPGD
ncbi:MAG: ParB N-terminal domain-containing protein [Planctomycetes bacterium]|nr:ParB N-terminal domain-containing protein [Planctomycetota bacterium]